MKCFYLSLVIFLPQSLFCETFSFLLGSVTGREMDKMCIFSIFLLLALLYPYA